MPSATLSVTKGDKNAGLYAQGYDANGKPARTPAGGLLSSSWALKASLGDMEGYLKAAVGNPAVPADLRSAMRLAQTGYFQVTSGASIMQAGLGWFLIPIEKLLKSDFVWDTSKRPAPKPVEVLASPQFNGNSLIDKGGATNGFQAYIGVIPDQRVGIVILTNKYIYSGAVRDLGRTLLINMTPLAGQFN